MGEKKSSANLWIVLVVIVGLVLCCALGAVVGGLAGYRLGLRAGQMRVPDTLGELPSPQAPMPRFRVPTPQSPESAIPWRGGALVVNVVQGSPAEQAGLQTGDIIIAVNDQPLDGENLQARLSRYNPGDKLKLEILRAGSSRTVEVVLGRHPQRGGDTPWLGIDYRNVPASFQFETPRPNN
jgi:membrane-associated protease RseP (regulator of RpoE activity)